MKRSQLSQIWIYPVKSLGGISLDFAKVMPKGLQYDRRWMLVDSTGMFLTQRQFPMLSKFKTSIDSDNLIIQHDGDRLVVGLHDKGEMTLAKSQIWDDIVTTQEVSAHHSNWFSERIGIDCKLVFFPEENPRAVDPKYKVNDDHTSLSDAYPLLIIGQASLDDLNQRLPKPVPINRFRPNFVFTGGEPFEEDNWRNFKIGSNQFVGVKPCSRCTMTTVDHETGERGTEPLKTLSTYRTRNNKVYFGQNAIATKANVVSVGDLITIE
jgi:uncharacterized protein YcbX